LLDLASQPIHLLLKSAQACLEIARWASRDTFLRVGWPIATAIVDHVGRFTHKVARSANHVADWSLSAGDPIAQRLKPTTEILCIPTAINRELNLIARIHPANRRNELINRAHRLTIQGNNPISRLQPHLVGWSARLGPGYHHALTIFTCHNVDTQARATTASVATLGPRWTICLILLRCGLGCGRRVR
jgi:hypothetical protein